MVEPLGTDTPVKVDLRLVSATHRNLREQVANGSFREDLYYRINVLDVVLPPLRDREGDLPLLIAFFLDGFAEKDEQGVRRAPTLSSDAYAALSAYAFPGNVRELDHAIERAVVLAGREEITLDHLPAVIAEAAPASRAASPLPAALSIEPEGLVMPLLAAARPVRGGPLPPRDRGHRGASSVQGGRDSWASPRKSLWEKMRIYDLDAAAPKPLG